MSELYERPCPDDWTTEKLGAALVAGAADRFERGAVELIVGFRDGELLDTPTFRGAVGVDRGPPVRARPNWNAPWQARHADRQLSDAQAEVLTLASSMAVDLPAIGSLRSFATAVDGITDRAAALSALHVLMGGASLLWLPRPEQDVYVDTRPLKTLR